MRVSVLFNYDTSSLLCSSLMIFYTTMSQFNSWFKDEWCFLCIRDAHDCNIHKATFSYSMIVIYWAEKYVMKERCTQWKDKVWLYWVILFFSWFDLCHVDVEWIVSINMWLQSFNVWLWSMKKNAFWSFSWLSIFYVNKWMTWHQVKKMSSSFFNILTWSTSHYFFKHCSHVFQYLRQLFYLISFHQLLNNIINVMKMFWYRRSRRVTNSSITCSHNFQTQHLNCLITSSIFSSLTDIDMSLIFFVDRLWLLERVLLHEWKLCMMTFLIT